MKISPLAGKPAPPEILVDVPRLVGAYYSGIPDPELPGQQVAFGTSGHRGSAFDGTFNEWHVLAMTQAICRYRAGVGTVGPLFLGIDTHALSAPASLSALEVTTADGPQASPTASSSRLRTIRRRTAGSSTTRRTAGRRTPG